jgi:5'-nucleotidase (lipoprotein e(P4) family)
MTIRHLLALCALLLNACASAPTDPDPTRDGGLLWVKHSAEYRAITEQVYADATRDLPGFIDDTSWSVIPGQDDAAHLPVAVILDVDETVVSNARYQETLLYIPYTRVGHFNWMRDNPAMPIRGAAEMIAAARDAGVEVFFLTNRACERLEGVEGECPYEQVTIDDLREAAIQTDPDHVLLAWEQPGWNKEKLNRREYLAETYRVIMLFGDDYGDFVHCTRPKPLPPCTDAATRESRHAALDTYADYWGNGWYILPNPMHGSWTTVR